MRVDVTISAGCTHVITHNIQFDIPHLFRVQGRHLYQFEGVSIVISWSGWSGAPSCYSKGSISVLHRCMLCDNPKPASTPLTAPHSRVRPVNAGTFDHAQRVPHNASS